MRNQLQFAFLGLAGVFMCGNSSSENIVQLESLKPRPIISYLDGTSDFMQNFNPAYIPPSPSSPISGLLVRVQNCTAIPGTCAYCGFEQCKGEPSPSVFAFSARQSDGSFGHLTAESIVFRGASAAESLSVEDPRVTLYNGTYYMTYTAVGDCQSDDTPDDRLSMATSIDPTNSSAWIRHGPIWPSPDKTGFRTRAGILIPRETGPHYMLFYNESWNIYAAVSDDLQNWQVKGVVLGPRGIPYADGWLTEPGPPPLRLSNGDYLLLYNGCSVSGYLEGYSMMWAVLSGDDPTKVVARSDWALLWPNVTWDTGLTPDLCNAPNVVFVEGAMQLANETDHFEVFFGASDTVVGSAIVAVDVKLLEMKKRASAVHGDLSHENPSVPPMSSPIGKLAAKQKNN